MPHVTAKLALLLLMPLLLQACGESETANTQDYTAPGTPTSGDMYVSASLGDATSLVPVLAGEASASAIAGYLYNSLLKYDKNLSLVGDLAEKWVVSDDNLSITFTLRQGVNWHDGKPFTAQDVLATYQAVINPNTRTPYAGDYQRVVSAEVIDDHTFKVTYAEPFAPALSSWAGLHILPAHIITNEADFNETSLKTQPVGTGPYILEKWNRDKDVILVANPNYFEGAPLIQKVRIRVIPDQDTQFLELKAGHIDSMGLKPLQFTRLTEKPEFTDRYAKYKYLSNGYTYLGFNLKNPLFADKNVRQALSFATPREQIIQGVLHGQGEPITGVFKPGTWAYNATLTPYPYTPAKAKELLDKAGWVDSDGDGIRDKDGQPFAFTVITNQGNDQRIKTAEILQQAYADIGVKLTIQVQEWSTFVENTLHPRAFEAIILGWSLSVEPDPYDIWHSSKQGPREFNIIGFEHAAADRLMEQARVTFDQAQRKAYLDDFQAILHEEQPYLFLYAPYALVALHKRFKNVEPAPAGISYNFEDWYVPESQQKYLP